jgi:hypothetical protein
MHTAQKHFKDMEAYSKHFINPMKLKLEGRSLDNALSMDQTPIPFSFHSNTTLKLKGAHMVHSLASTMDTKHVTLAVMVTAWKMLTPFFIFKGKPHGWIALHEFGMYPDTGMYACQEKERMNEWKMNKCISAILQSCKANRDKNPSAEQPIMILDVF